MSKVEVVEGFNASLPCLMQITSSADTPVLTLWYIGTQETPIYSYDQRDSHSKKGLEWSDINIFGSRVSYLADEPTPALHIANVTRKDARMYRCRVDYKESHSRMAWVKLSVIVPPSDIRIELIRPIVELGEKQDVACKVFGGTPPPRVIWTQAGKIVDTNTTYLKKQGISINVLDVEATRRDMELALQCQAFNNDVSQAIVATFRRNVTCEPLSVSIITNSGTPLVSGQDAEFICLVIGSNPPPKIVWFLEKDRITTTTLLYSKNETRSSFVLSMNKEHNMKNLRCIVTNFLLPKKLKEAFVILDVAFKPEAHLEMINFNDSKSVVEGTDVAFQCKVDSNPSPYKIQWLFQDKVLEGSDVVKVKKGIMILEKVNASFAGRIQCLASNVEGDSLSNNITIDIKYSPKCLIRKNIIRGLAAGESTNLTCRVQANPPNVSFFWTFNHTRRVENFTSAIMPQDGMSSTLSYKVNSEKDLGTISCYATNTIGEQKVPCQFTIIRAVSPHEVKNCLIFNATLLSVSLTCKTSSIRGVSQKFLLQVFDFQTGGLAANMTSDKPFFVISPLEPGNHYRASVTAFNRLGSSKSIYVSFSTPRVSETHKSLPSMVAPFPWLWAFMSFVGVILITSFITLILWHCRRSRSGNAHKEDSRSPDLINVEALPAKIKNSTENFATRRDNKSEIRQSDI